MRTISSFREEIEELGFQVLSEDLLPREDYLLVSKAGAASVLVVSLGEWDYEVNVTEVEDPALVDIRTWARHGGTSAQKLTWAEFWKTNGGGR